MELVSCPVCENSSFIHIYRLPNTPATQNRDLTQCLNCTHVFVNPITPQEYTDVSTDVFHFDKDEAAKNRFDFFYDQFMSFYKNTPGRILELGCGMGHFLGKCKREGWQVIGIEPSKAVAEFAKTTHNMDVITGYYEKMFIADTFDSIVAIEVLEHTVKPMDFLHRIFNNLKHTGMLYLTVPNFSTKRLTNDHTKKQWHEWEAMVPYGHLHFFKPGLLTQVLYNTGFKRVTLTWQVGAHQDEQLIACAWKT